MRSILLIGAFALSALFGATPVLASGNCSLIGDSMISCSGYTDGRFVNGYYVNGQYVTTARGMVWVDGYYVNGYWENGYYYSLSCNHIGRSWSCTQTVPAYATWTVPD